MDDVGRVGVRGSPYCGKRGAVAGEAVVDEVQDRGGAVDVCWGVAAEDARANHVLQGGPEPVVLWTVGGCLVEDGREFGDKLGRHRVMGCQVDVDDWS